MRKNFPFYTQHDNMQYGKCNTGIISVKPFISTLPTDYKQVIMNDPSTISS
ncbi:hypothetical protein [Phocaeicola dorei]|uniref:Uncharacterized protein n=1 Tax=Phocaeicola dorei CL03T12C01 TaxID=997877 RepID=I9R3C0_9BACT|nr:hypothetical protein [Phocaeicola dorei]EIY36771.1 hypothetical protein HMPREF1065_02688 [Phocaeicola dorei CL03T12C01]